MCAFLSNDFFVFVVCFFRPFRLFTFRPFFYFLFCLWMLENLTLGIRLISPTYVLFFFFYIIMFLFVSEEYSPRNSWLQNPCLTHLERKKMYVCPPKYNTILFWNHNKHSKTAATRHDCNVKKQQRTGKPV